MALKENYKDDILDVSQNVKRKYQMENNGDGTVSFTDVTEYTQQGDSFGASDMNAVNSEVNEVVNNLGAKNMLPNNATTRTINGITFTVNSDGSIGTSGTSTDGIGNFIIGQITPQQSGKYILSGCSGGTDNTYFFNFDDGTTTYRQYNDEIQLDLVGGTTYSLRLWIATSGVDMSNKTFYPMVRPASIADDTYVPYAQTNKELTDNLTDGIGGTADKFRFGTDGNGNYGYIKKVEGADTFFPFKGVDNATYITTNYGEATTSGSGYSVSVSTNLKKYKTLYIMVVAFVCYSSSASIGNLSITNNKSLQITKLKESDSYRSRSYSNPAFSGAERSNLFVVNDVPENTTFTATTASGFGFSGMEIMLFAIE
jgi:hypothetical protein